MDISVLEVRRRPEVGSAAVRRIRRQGGVPAVLYGHGEDVISLTVDGEALRSVIEGEQRVVRLGLEGGEQRALVKSVQWDTFGREILHVDFTRVAMHERVAVSVRLELHGTPKGVTAGGVLEHPLNAIEIECSAAEIPDHFRVEVGHLEFGQMVHVGDVQMPEGVKVLTDPNAVVAVMHAPKGDVTEAAAEPGPTEPELIGRAAKPEEEEESPK